VAGCCEHGIETAASVKYWEILELIDYWSMKKDFVTRI
jgi:hypothetical protein